MPSREVPWSLVENIGKESSPCWPQAKAAGELRSRNQRSFQDPLMEIQGRGSIVVDYWCRCKVVY